LKAVNYYGDSDYSEELPAAIAPLPSKPANVMKDQILSTKTSIRIVWNKLPDTLPAKGYKLYMKDEAIQSTSLVYDGSSNANVLYYLKNNLTTGYSYTFTLVAVNFNGEGPASNSVTFKSCTAPSNIRPPYATSTTKTTIDLSWTPPADSGGCSITGYELYVDDGNGGIFVNTDASSIANKPYLRSHELTFNSS
jgi:titin